MSLMVIQTNTERQQHTFHAARYVTCSLWVSGCCAYRRNLNRLERASSQSWKNKTHKQPPPPQGSGVTGALSRHIVWTSSTTGHTEGQARPHDTLPPKRKRGGGVGRREMGPRSARLSALPAQDFLSGEAGVFRSPLSRTPRAIKEP